ncbi:UNVERIFIED_CONTAM: hypothetical protein FKN15_010048 [Acipenser sinensis]
MGAPGKNMTKSTSIGGDMYSLEKNDGSQSDTAVGTVGTVGKKRRSSIGAKMVAIVGLSRKSRSTSQLSQTDKQNAESLILIYNRALVSLLHFKINSHNQKKSTDNTRGMLEKRLSRGSAERSASLTPAQRSSPSPSGREVAVSSPYGSVPREIG